MKSTSSELIQQVYQDENLRIATIEDGNGQTNTIQFYQQDKDGAWTLIKEQGTRRYSGNNKMIWKVISKEIGGQSISLKTYNTFESEGLSGYSIGK